MNKHIPAIGLLFGMLLSFNACDTREDAFYKDNPTPELSLLDGEQYSECRQIKVRYGETVEVHYDYKDGLDNEFGTYTVEYVRSYRADGFLDPAVKYTSSPKGRAYPFNSKYTDFRIDKKNKLFVITDKSIPLDHLDNKDYGRGYEVMIKIKVKNGYGKECSANLNVIFGENKRPAPTIEVKNTRYPMEKTIEVKANDPDGDDAVKYEYCIDGTVLNNSGGWELDGFKTDGVDKEYVATASGKAAYNGTYIKATDRACIQHAFQKAGYHNIYVRCKDQWGLWSEWTKKEIYVNEN